ncbi:MAG TPA: AsmA-like C-terminal region-containing protein [Candidatus Aquilonibacter sp.]|nr:AsmA-like C-terminal region-containing protein [Candidatus Aquilonibacter sp.]
MQPGFWRKCRVCFRWLRVSVWLVLLAAICTVVWFNRVGLPDFLKTRLVATLRERGIELEFSRMRLRFEHGIVAENVRIGGARTNDSPTLSAVEVQLRLGFRALLRRQLQVSGLVLRQGQLIWPVSPTNALRLDNIQADLRFQTNDTWSLDNFQADFAGAKLALSGEVEHAPELRKLKIFSGPKSANNGALPDWLQKFSDTLRQIHYPVAPQLRLIVNGDARDLRSFVVHLAVAQGETRLQLTTGGEGAATGDYLCHFHGEFDPETIRPFLTASNVAHAFEIVKLTEPLALDADVSGRPDDYASLTADGYAALTNFTVHGKAVGDVTTEFHYASGVLEFREPQLHTGAQMMSADTIALNFNTRLIYFTNGFSTADPESVARAIGSKTAEWMEPYHFLKPPAARVNGQLPLRDIKEPRDIEDADMNFDVVRGAPFKWLNFRTTNIVGTIRWQGQVLILTNVAAAFYGGNGKGFAIFDFRTPHEGADYEFTADVTNVDLHALAANLSSLTNDLEGTLSGKLIVTRADTRNWRTWDGYGHARLRNGLIWNEPIFGILSPVLNAVSPGLGSSRATDASAEFAITNGVIHTDSLEIRATMAQLQYAGTVDLAGNVNLRVNAQLLHNTWMVGPLFSTALWPVSKLFECQVTGTLEKPKSDPIYVPKFLLMPLHPLRSFEQLFSSGAITNTPPGN